MTKYDLLTLEDQLIAALHGVGELMAYEIGPENTDHLSLRL